MDQMSITPQISIIVPVYNAEKYIRRCIESIVSQSNEDWELILVDDGSPDNSGTICDEYAVKDGRIKVLHKVNGGVSSARNAGMDVARGAYVTFCDSDDYYLQDALLHYRNYIEENRNCDILIGGWQSVAAGGEVREEHVLPKKNVEGTFLSENTLLSVCLVLFKRELIVNNQLRFLEGLSYSEDAAFLCEYALYSKRYCMIPCATYAYYYNSESATKGIAQGLRHKISQQCLAAKTIGNTYDKACIQKQPKALIFDIKKEKCRCFQWIVDLVHMNNFSYQSIQVAFGEIRNNFSMFSRECKCFVYLLLRRRLFVLKQRFL